MSLAQDAPTKPSGGKVIAPEPAPDPNAIAALEKARKALQGLTRLSFAARSSVEGKGSEHAPIYTADVQATRAEAGGWKVAANGRAGTAKDEKGGTVFKVGYDGATAWSIKDSDKVVLEKPVGDMERLSQFFTEQGAGHVVAWEMLADVPLIFEGWVPTMGEGLEVEGTPCEVVVLRRAANNPPAGDADTDTEVRLSLGRDDHLPRRIDRVREVATEKGASNRLTRSLVLRGLATEGKAAPGSYLSNAPDGYAIREIADRQVRKTTKLEQRRERSEPRAEGPLIEHDDSLLAVGAKMPEFKLKDAQGKEVTAATYRGKVLVVDFWGSWCPPCRAAMPGVQKLHEKYKDKGVVVVGFNSERQAKADPVKFMEENGYTYGLVLNAEKVASKFKVPGWPTFYVFSPEGKVLWGGVGADPRAEETMSHYIEMELKKMEGGEKKGEAEKK
jgi:thiol-disulfide isomerase/thioredoxin